MLDEIGGATNALIMHIRLRYIVGEVMIFSETPNRDSGLASTKMEITDLKPGWKTRIDVSFYREGDVDVKRFVSKRGRKDTF